MLLPTVADSLKLRVFEECTVLQDTVRWLEQISAIFLLNLVEINHKKIFKDHTKIGGFQKTL